MLAMGNLDPVFIALVIKFRDKGGQNLGPPSANKLFFKTSANNVSVKITIGRCAAT